MADAKISELAEVVGVSVDKLLSQIKEAGLSHTKADDSISNDDKNTLLQLARLKRRPHMAGARLLTSRFVRSAPM
jgi:translation initiation factor IF-2